MNSGKGKKQKKNNKKRKLIVKINFHGIGQF